MARAKTALAYREGSAIESPYAKPQVDVDYIAENILSTVDGWSWWGWPPWGSDSDESEEKPKEGSPSENSKQVDLGSQTGIIDYLALGILLIAAYFLAKKA